MINWESLSHHYEAEEGWFVNVFPGPEVHGQALFHA